MRCYSKLRLRCVVVVLLIAGSCARVEAATQRMVFAHYMLANQDYVSADASSEAVIASYQREIGQAQAIGIDGFALNAGGWFREPRYILRASEMFEAAYRMHTGFRLMFSADMCCGNGAADVVDMVRRFAGNARYAGVYYASDGKFVLTTFAGSNKGPGFWRVIKTELEGGARTPGRDVETALPSVNGTAPGAALKVMLVPAFFWGGELPKRGDIERGVSDYNGIVDGAFYWGIAGVPGLGKSPDQMPSAAAYASVLHGAGKIYMAPICFQFWGANAGRYYEYSGFAGLRKLWMQAIDVSHPEWVEIITWNDFIEGTYVSPINDPAKYEGANDLGKSAAPAGTLHYFHSHRGVTELLAYYIEWYKSGVQPVVKHDAAFWAYKTQLGNSYGKEMKLYGPMKDAIYVTSNLTAEAELDISVGGKVTTVRLPAGSNDVEIPVGGVGMPVFTLRRGGKTVAEGAGEEAILAHADHPSLYTSTGSMHD